MTAKPTYFALQNEILAVKEEEVNKVNLYIALLRPLSKALRYGPCVKWEHTVSPAHTHTQTLPAFTPQPQGISLPFGWYSLHLPTTVD